jgi:4-amino-4-deoxy-L-arabinose transferase-like glycosyltransferase
VGTGRFFAVRLVQAGLNALMAPLTYLVSLRLFPGNQPAAIISAWIVVCYPLLIIYPIGLATENLFFLFVLAAIYFLLQIPDSEQSIPYSLLSGLFLALAALTRSVILPFAGLAVFWTYFLLKQKRAAVIMALTLITLIIPWVIRNSLLHHELTSIESSMGYNLYLGYHPESNGSFTFGPSLDLLSILDDAERDRIGKNAAIAFIRAQPERFFPLLLNRLGFFFGLEKRALMYIYSNNLIGYIPSPILLTISAILLMPFVIIAPSGALGLALSRLRPGVVLFYLLFVPYILVHVLILSEDRFHLVLIPFLAIFAARVWTLGLGAFLACWRESTMGKIAVSLAILAALLLFLNWGLELSRDADKIAALLGPNGNQTHFPY